MYDPYGNKQNQYPQLFEDTSGSNSGYYNQGYSNNQYDSGASANGQGMTATGTGIPTTGNANSYMYPNVASQFVQDPLVANMAMKFGQDIVGQGRQMVDEKLGKIVSVSKVKYYFAVDTNYVLQKIKLLFFPYTHRDWSIRFNNENEEPVQPRYDINAPDLYIPLMAFVTYILIAGLSLGLQDRFSPDILGIQASWAVVCLILELGVILASFHIMSIQTKIQFLHILALASYKYVGMIMCLFGGIIYESVGYYSVLGYCSLSFIIFTFRALRCHIQSDHNSIEGYSTGTKRRLYLLICISSLQPFIMWLLTRHLVFFSRPPIVPFDRSY